MKRALLVIDVQYEYFTGRLKVSYPEKSFENIIRAIDSANRLKIPVILIQHGSEEANAEIFAKGSPQWEIVKEVLGREHICIIEKKSPGSFTGTGLEALLREVDIDTVVISGYMTQMCCDTTARQAMHLGFKAEFLSDATGTLDISNNAGSITAAELHKAILITQATCFSKVLTCDEWVKAIEQGG